MIVSGYMEGMAIGSDCRAAVRQWLLTMAADKSLIYAPTHEWDNEFKTSFIAGQSMRDMANPMDATDPETTT
jgi:hypothetical protein